MSLLQYVGCIDRNTSVALNINATSLEYKPQARTSKLTPAPYEKAQTSEEMIYMQAVRSSWQLSTEVLHAHECVKHEPRTTNANYSEIQNIPYHALKGVSISIPALYEKAQAPESDYE